MMYGAIPLLDKEVRFADSDGVHRTPEIGAGGAEFRFSETLRLLLFAGQARSTCVTLNENEIRTTA
jgi:hypothetical protein